MQILAAPDHPLQLAQLQILVCPYYQLQPVPLRRPGLSRLDVVRLQILVDLDHQLPPAPLRGPACLGMAGSARCSCRP
ncbi:hypothetical protein [Ectopseudomonas oleovorans]|uniref:Uncharacterized protein n=1 Tax=Ectopseudomonas oleovorans TaxID=301 RepID=A0A3D9E741_ECTOL|nr:hypothetical protein [Pseudomonas oleovorans]REC98876.1 hypothetical protein DFO60_4936 [Pseudomonas oleovorans]